MRIKFSKKIFQKKYRIYLLGILILPFVLFLFFDLLFPFKPKISYSQIILAKDSTVLHTFLNKDEKWRLKTELHEISPLLRKTIIFKEDKYFYYHFGINPIAVIRASVMNWVRFRKTSGASTITMQVARLLQPKNRTYSNKILETFRALQLEWHFSKDEILQMYLNLVPYGSNIEGVKSAALLFFNQKPERLSLAQITALAIVPNRPSSLALGKNNALIEKERNKWLKRFQKNKVFSAKSIKNALIEPLTVKRRDAPDFAPHFSQRLKEENPNETAIYTHLNFENQQKVQQIAFNYIQRLGHLNIHNAAVLVVNNQTKAVEVYVGSADFEDKFNAGEVDGIKGIRSPGSTLKPFAYTLAMDKGLITPKSILADVPSIFSGFEPENFYKRFQGNISAEKALIQSLNIPAVKLLEDIGVNYFINKLKEANFKQINKDEKKLGLSMILGGCGVTLEEMTTLFAAFANSGKYNSLIFKQKDVSRKSHQIISSESAFMISEILAQAKRPDLPISIENTLRASKVAWKTGTSFGRRDAWSIGYNPRYTVGVWIGNFSGEGVNELIGAEVATPLLFEIFNTIDYNANKNWFAAPKNLKPRWVCSETGLVPNTFCENQVLDTYVPLVSNPQKCNHLKEVIVSEDEKIAYCLTCRPLQGYKKKFYPNLSPELLAFYEGKSIAYQKIPPHNLQCTQIFEDNAPIIISPSAAKEYMVDRTEIPEIELACKASNEVKTVYWYINEEFYRASPPNETIFFKPAIGFIKISCSDDKGRNSDIQIKVSYE